MPGAVVKSCEESSVRFDSVLSPRVQYMALLKGVSSLWCHCDAMLCSVHICVCMCDLSCMYCTTRKWGCLTEYLLWFLPIHFLKEQRKQ